jgi:hypothetical protein
MTRKECEDFIKRHMPNKRKISVHIDILWWLCQQRAVDWQSAKPTKATSQNKNAGAYLNEMEDKDIVKKRENPGSHFTDGYTEQACFSRADAAIVESRNFRELRRLISANPQAAQTALQATGEANEQAMMNTLMSSRDRNHKKYNDAIAALKQSGLVNRSFKCDEMGWRSNSNYWYLTPRAIRELNI